MSSEASHKRARALVLECISAPTSFEDDVAEVAKALDEAYGEGHKTGLEAGIAMPAAAPEQVPPPAAVYGPPPWDMGGHRHDLEALPQDLLNGISETLSALGRNTPDEVVDALRNGVARAYARGRLDERQTAKAAPAPVEAQPRTLEKWLAGSIRTLLAAYEIQAATSVAVAVASPNGERRKIHDLLTCEHGSATVCLCVMRRLEALVYLDATLVRGVICRVCDSEIPEHGHAHLCVPGGRR